MTVHTKEAPVLLSQNSASPWVLNKGISPLKLAQLSSVKIAQGSNMV